MAIQCPKCSAENPDTQRFCGECGTQITPDKEVFLTKTLETPIEELTTGSIFAGRYQIIEELGRGGMGRVYRAKDTKLNEEVALKLIKPEIASSKKTIERFSNELRLARKIRHNNVGSMYELLEEEGTSYITMEYVSGQDLKGLIRQSGNLAINTSISIAKQVCEGLAEAHKLGIIHRDLKPSNVMIDKEGNVRIMDFGIARSLKEKGITGAGVMIGTPEYMSPEQVEGKETDQRSDIYSMGVILYEMVTGRVPFEGDTPFTIGVKHKSEIPKNPKELNSQIPEDLGRVILKCLEKDKANRYQSAGEVRSELEGIEKGIPTTERVIPKRKPLTSKEITVTFDLKKLFIPALALIALVIIAVVLWRVLLKKEVTLLPEEKQSIAVISFDNQTGDMAYDHLRKIIPNLLITGLEQSGYFNVATWERMHDLLKQLGKEEVELIDRDLGFELCQMDGIDAIVLGSFGKAGDMFATDVKVLDVETKSLLKSASSRGEGEGSIIKTQIDELSKEILKGIGLSESRIEATKMQIVDVTTSSMEAYDYYLKGRESQIKIFREEAIQYYEKAVELDPTFAMAYLGLEGANSGLGNTKESIAAVEKAKSFSEKLTDKEKLYLEAAYARVVEEDQEKRFKILQNIASKYPKEKDAHYALGWYYQSRVRDREKAIEEYNKVLELDPNHESALNQIGYTYWGMSNYDKAVEYFKKAASVNPESPNPLDSLADIYFSMGRLDEALAKLKEALKIKPDFLYSSHNIPYIYALKGDYPEAIKWVDRYTDISPSSMTKWQGHVWKGFYNFWLDSFEKSLIDLKKAEDHAIKAENEWGKAFVNWFKAWMYYDKGELDLSKKYNEAWLEVFISEDPRRKQFYVFLYNFTLGLLEAEEKRVELSKKRLDRIRSAFPEVTSSREKEWVTFYSDLLLAEILLATGEIEKAIAAFENTSPISPSGLQYTQWMIIYNFPSLKDVLARAYQQQGEIDKAIAEYERLIIFDPKSKGRHLIHPKYHYRLAKLYEKKGWKGKAIEHYEKFLTLWKDADPGIAEAEEAKKRLSKL